MKMESLSNIKQNQIIVLISTYNGAKYLKEQLDSIYEQTYKKFKIYVRDDGSQDLTQDILENYKKRYDNFEWFSGKNLGVSKSFFSLMQSIRLENAIYVFADQDDIWKKFKLEHINSVFAQYDNKNMLLYCGDTILVNDKMQILKNENLGKNIRPSFGNSLVENICIGCTAAMNEPLFKKIINRIPEHEVMHDWWFYLTAAYYGNVIYDEEALVYYRQHESNVMGSGATKLGRIVRRVKNYKSHKNQISQQVREFSKVYNVDYDKCYLLQCIKNYKNNIGSCLQLIKSEDIYRQRRIDDFIFKILFLFKQL